MASEAEQQAWRVHPFMVLIMTTRCKRQIASSLFCQIESVKAIDNIEEICAVEGIDVIFIGRNDLAADSGHILNLDHPDRLAVRVVTAAKRAGLKLGTVPSAGHGWAELFKDGLHIVLPSADISLLRDAARAEVAVFCQGTSQLSKNFEIFVPSLEAMGTQMNPANTKPLLCSGKPCPRVLAQECGPA